MSPALKRIMLIGVLLIFSSALTFGLYYFFKKAAPAPRAPAGAPAEVGRLPAAGERELAAPGAVPAAPAPGGLPPAGITAPPPPPSYYRPEPVSKITSDISLYPSLNSSGDMRYHNASDGKFYRVAADGSVKEMTDQVFYNVKNVTWAKSKDKAVLEYPDGSKTIYDFDLKKQVSLPKHWEDFSFSPDASHLAAKSLGLSPENRWLVVTKDDGTDTKLIEPLGDNADKVTMNWSPSNQTVALAQTGQAQGADRREVLFVGLNGENFKSTIVEGLDFKPAWSPTGKKMLYSVDSARSDFKPELWIVNSFGDDIGSGRRMLELNTWANKCAFANDDTLYCAVPRDLPQGAGMSPEVAADNADDLYKIDLKTGLRTSVPLGQDFTIDSISFNESGNKVLFTDHHQNGIFEVKM